MKEKRGRKPDNDIARSKRFCVRLSKEEYEQMEYLREYLGLSASELFRETIKEQYFTSKNS